MLCHEDAVQYPVCEKQFKPWRPVEPKSMHNKHETLCAGCVRWNGHLVCLDPGFGSEHDKLKWQEPPKNMRRGCSHSQKPEPSGPAATT